MELGRLRIDALNTIRTNLLALIATVDATSFFDVTLFFGIFDVITSRRNEHLISRWNDVNDFLAQILTRSILDAFEEIVLQAAIRILVATAEGLASLNTEITVLAEMRKRTNAFEVVWSRRV